MIIHLDLTIKSIKNYLQSYSLQLCMCKFEFLFFGFFEQLEHDGNAQQWHFPPLRFFLLFFLFFAHTESTVFLPSKS